jgi:hypothetical protein
MSSQAQIDANRATARKSTGPRTDEGKQRVAQNATRHGLFSRSIILPGEDPEELAALHDGFYARLKPADALERAYVDRIVYAAWKLARVPRAEAEHAEHCFRHIANKDVPEDLAGGAVWYDIGACDHYTRYQVTLERQMDRSLNELRKLQKERRENADADPGFHPAPTVTAACEKTNPIPASSEKEEEFKPNPAQWHGFSTCENDENHGLQSRATNAVPREEKKFEFKPNSNPAEAIQSSASQEQEMKTD